MNGFVKRIVFKILKVLTPAGTSRIVRFGPLRGLKWIYSSGYSQYWMGSYERVITEQFVKYAGKCDVIYDLGANIGYYTLIASKSVGQKGQVYSFEPFPSNIKSLKKHIDLNKINNITVFESAVSNKNGITAFTNSDNNVANSICENSPMFIPGNSIEVETVRLDDLIQNSKIQPPQLIKMDIEGSEYEALLGAEKLLNKYHPTIFLSTHNCQNEGVHKKCCDFLTQIGYSLKYFNFHEKITETDDPWYELIAEYHS